MKNNAKCNESNDSLSIDELIEHGDEPRTNYENFTTLLKAGIKGLRDVYPESKVIIHLERSYDIKIYDEFFTNLEKYDVK